jgi:hypothetical protein
VIPLETIRLGLRGDTFDHFLGEIKIWIIPNLKGWAILLSAFLFTYEST